MYSFTLWDIEAFGLMNYTFDNADRLAQIAQGTSTVAFSYDAANRRTALTLPNGVVTGYSYDAGSQLTAITHQIGPSVIGNLSYGYDLAGRRIQVGGSFAPTGIPPALTSATYNAANQLTQWGGTVQSYDANGNLTSDVVNSYTWNARNQLASISGGTVASFQYDPFGRRVTRNILGTATNFLYDGANAVQEVIGGTNTANSLMGGVDEVFQRTDASGARSFLGDALGSTLALTDGTGAVQTSYTFDPFGNTTQSGSHDKQLRLHGPRTRRR
jgi:YD repeat-containing protein